MGEKDNIPNNNNLYSNSYTVRYKDLMLIASKSASREMTYLRLTLEDCKFILEKGYTSLRKRSKEKEEKWFNSGRKIYNIVIGQCYNHSYKEDVYVIIHIGRFTKL